MFSLTVYNLLHAKPVRSVETLAYTAFTEANSESDFSRAPCVALPKSSNMFFSLDVLLANSLFQRCIDRIMSNLVSYWLHGHAPVIGTNLISSPQNEFLNCRFISGANISAMSFYCLCKEYF